MQTRFSADQLRDPKIAEADSILRACVHCGFCTATCPTYLETGDERDSPRGRIWMIRDMLEQGGAPDPVTVHHLDRCLTCASCLTTCPSGVHYPHLVDIAREKIEQQNVRPASDRLMRSALVALLTRPRLFAGLMGLARPFKSLLQTVMPFAQAKKALGMIPDQKPALPILSDSQSFPAVGETKAKVALLQGCAQQAVDAAITHHAISLLTRAGVEVVIRKEAACCGALPQHLGQTEKGEAMARAAVAGWADEFKKQELDAILVTTSGCGPMVQDYGRLLKNDPDWAAWGQRISAKAMDITTFLVGMGGLPETVRGQGQVIAYHAACTMQHGLKEKTASETLLTQAGFNVVKPKEPHICCGAAGTYTLLQPQLSEQLADRKAANLQATGANIVVAGNIGCITQIAGAADMKVLHTIALLDWATGGTIPVKL